MLVTRLLGGVRRGRADQAEVLAAPAAGVEGGGRGLGRGRRLAGVRQAAAAGVRRRGPAGTGARRDAGGRVRHEAVAAARPDHRPGRSATGRTRTPRRLAKRLHKYGDGVADVRGVRGRAVEQQPRGAGGAAGGADAEGELRQPERARGGDAGGADERVPDAEEPGPGPAANDPRRPANLRRHRHVAPAAGESQFRRLKGYGCPARSRCTVRSRYVCFG